MPSSRVSETRKLSRLWQAVDGRLELEMNPAAYKTWLDGARPLRKEGSELIVEARSSFVAEWLNTNLQFMVDAEASKIAGESLTVDFVAPAQTKPESAEAGSAPARDGGDEAPTLIGKLNRTFTFDRYLPTMGNRLAMEMATAIVDDPATAISPLVIYGVPGMGKTHLLHAVAAYGLTRGLSCACLTAEDFTNLYQRALRTKGGEAVEAFHDQIRAVDLLIIDDLQGMAGKTRTVGELVFTIEAVVNAGGSVVAASETNPLQLDFPNRLTSRLGAGLITALDPFDQEERRLFVERTARDGRSGLPSWCVDRLAAASMPSVRLMLGAVHAAIALQRIENLDEGSLDTELLRLTMVQRVEDVPEEIVIERILAHFEATFEEVHGRSRRGLISDARALLTVALHQRGESFAAIGRRLDDRDRTTIRELYATGRKLAEAQPQLKAVAGIA